MSNLREKMEIENKENMAHTIDSFIRILGKLYLYRNKKESEFMYQSEKSRQFFFSFKVSKSS